MQNLHSIPKIIFSERLILIPFTIEICNEILKNQYQTLEILGLKKGKNWPDLDILETLPKIIINLSKVLNPTGFESWMIIKKETNEIIGDIGFKGLKDIEMTCDIGYGIIENERKKGFAEEAAKSLINYVINLNSSINITASTLIENNPSIKLLEKLNFIEINRNDTFIYWKLLKKNCT